MSTSATTEQQLHQLEQIHQLRNASSTALSRTDLQILIRALDPKAPLETDPNALEEVIMSYMDRFDALKFLFLEQESKEQFLRLVLEQNSKEINKEDILRALEESNEKKAELELKKESIDKLTLDIEGVAKANYGAIDFIDENTDSIAGKITEIESKKARIEQLRAELSAKKRVDTSIQKLQQMLPDLRKYGVGEGSLNDVHDLERVLQGVKADRDSIRSESVRLERSKNENDERIHRDLTRVQKLKKDKSRITSAVDNLKRLEEDCSDDLTLSQQKKEILVNEEKVLLLMKVWPLYSKILKLEVTDRVISVVFKDSSDMEVKIEMKDDTLIDSVLVDGLDEAQSEILIQQWNKETVPLHAASKAISSLLKEIST